MLFPHEGESPLLPYRGNNIALPSEEDYIELDNTVGTDYVCLIFSLESLDIKNLLAKMRSQTGDFQEKLTRILNSKIVPSKNVNLDKNKITFKAHRSGNTNLIPIVIEMGHVD